MKFYLLLAALLISTLIYAQKHTPLPHGMVFGIRPSVITTLKAPALEAFMGSKTRISTTIIGRVIKVTKAKGGWFQIDAGKGKIIAAHFRIFNITLPADLKGRTVIIEGVAQKQFIADDLQHFAGDTVTGKKQQKVKTNPKQRLTFEVKGLMVDQ